MSDKAGEDDFAGLKASIPDFAEYDEYALDIYRSLSFYFAQRADAGMSRPQAKAATCEVFGHDAPRGKCIRCGLGVDLDREEDRNRDRIAKRDAWLADRLGT